MDILGSPWFRSSYFRHGPGAIGALGSVPGTVCAHPLDVLNIRCLADLAVKKWYPLVIKNGKLENTPKK